MTSSEPVVDPFKTARHPAPTSAEQCIVLDRVAFTQSHALGSVMVSGTSEESPEASKADRKRAQRHSPSKSAATGIISSVTNGCETPPQRCLCLPEEAVAQATHLRRAQRPCPKESDTEFRDEESDSVGERNSQPGPVEHTSASASAAAASVGAGACQGHKAKCKRYCICRQPYDAKRNGDMIGCDHPNCAYGWFHISCLFLNPSYLRTSKPFICRFCSETGADLFASADGAKRLRKDGTRHLVADYARLHEGDIGGALCSGRNSAGALVEAARTAAERQAGRFMGAADEAVSLAASLGIRYWSNGYELDRIPDAPCVVRDCAGLDMRIPASAYAHEQVAREYGIDRICEVLDVASQRELEPRWSLGQYLDYLSTEASLRQRVLNLISLEISETPTGQAFQAPGIIRRADWATLCPPPRPHVDTYYLLSAAGSWTSWHIDFGGSTVFYHVLRGQKRFYVCPPTERHLLLYERWQSDPQQALREFDFVEELNSVATIDLEAGNTLFIPAGWLHAVFTPLDSVVLGGNILHLGGVTMQQRIYNMERRLHVPDKYRFPLFRELHWLALRQYATTIERRCSRHEDALVDFCAEEREQLRSLVDILRDQVQDALTKTRGDTRQRRHSLTLREALGFPKGLTLTMAQRWLARLDDALCVHSKNSSV
ncbi:hypothetical protein CCYA_CCYA19G4715 [Cyanidiococcus yangmingshanensis]|nr:hypothetical protein CCYA_CCYA19G4715 [Cyanidiococcus yangmingshanensis]